MCCIAVLFAGVLARGQVAGAYIGLSLASSMRLARTVNYCVRNFTQMEADMTSVERVLHYCSIPTERYEQFVVGSDWPPKASVDVVFEAVELRYRPDLPLVLDRVSFAIEAGMKLGVVGRTGSGKSSLVSRDGCPSS